ncbi:MAG: ABC transporter permease [Acidimicrobiales bacterium]
MALTASAPAELDLAEPLPPPVPARSRTPLLLWLVALGVAALLALPIVYVVVQASQTGWSEIVRLVVRRFTLNLVWNTVRLSAVVTVACAAIGTATAWLVEKTDLPGRRFWAVVVVLPVAIPDFVTGFGWVSVAPAVHGFPGAVLVMTLALYPLVYLPVAASFRGADPGQEEVARSLGLTRRQTFRRVTLAQARPALLGGSVLVALALLAEYGAFEVLRYQTLTTAIFFESERSYNLPVAASLALILVVISIAVLGGDALARGRGRVTRAMAPVRSRRFHRLGGATAPALAGLGALVGLALGVPVGVVLYWLVKGGTTTLPASASVAGAALTTAGYAAAAGLLATVLAFPVALLAVRHPRRSTVALERGTFVVQAVPGLIIALALVYFSVRVVRPLYLSTSLLIIGYAIMFFPLALVAVRTSMAQAPLALEDVARSLGRRRLVVWCRVVLPLVGPGLAAGFCLVFLSTVTELTLTLVLVPTGVQTLATQFWAFTTNLSYAAAAPYAGTMILIAVVPSYILGRWFDRLPARAGRR